MTPQDADLSGAVWRRSSYSAGNGGQCVEVAAVWRRSSHSASNGGQCVEVAHHLPAGVAVRDSKDPDGPHLIVSCAAWTAFVDRVKRYRG